MDPVLIGRPLLAIIIAMLVLGVLLLPFLDKGTAEYTITLSTVIMDSLFLVILIIWLRKKSQKPQKSKETGNPDDSTHDTGDQE